MKAVAVECRAEAVQKGDAAESWASTKRGQHESRLRLAAMVSQFDAGIGEFVAATDETGQRHDSLVVFTSYDGGIESDLPADLQGAPHCRSADSCSKACPS
ncbi:MAG: hypothetical protein WD072_10135 [Pirellulales bacterium]